MDLTKKRKDSKINSKKDKKLKKLINKSDSDSEESEHELSYYLKDRVKLMKEVLKIIKPKKIKSMAPDCIKRLDIEEINSMLLEELLGISNKRVKYIFNGQNLEEDSSSTDPEVEQQPIDVISLDDISEDDFIINLDSENETEKNRRKKHKPKIKQECRRKKIKKEKQDRERNGSSSKSKEPGKNKMDEQNLMSVLELLELQARARAIRSQLILENNKKAQEQGKEEHTSKQVESENEDTVIIESPKNIEIVITSSESETDEFAVNETGKENSVRENGPNDVENNTNIENKAKQNEVPVESNDSTEKSNKEQVTVEEENNDLVQADEDKVESGQEKQAKELDQNEDLRNENEGKATEDKTSSESEKKIINIETVIISPQKNNVTDHSEEMKKPQNTSEESDERTTEKKPTADSVRKKFKIKRRIRAKPKKSENVKSVCSSNSVILQTEQLVVDDGDSIIINMEQSEIDCIISD